MADILKVIIVYITIFSYFSYAEAKDFGTKGEIFAISEEDPVSLIKSKLERLEKTGELSKLQTEWKERTISTVQRPKAVGNIIKATETKTKFYDPTITVSSDISDHQGNIFAKKGQKINPFDRVPYYYPYLIFIDGDDDSQLEFAISRFKEQTKNHLNPKIILVRGNIIELIEKTRTRLFFDQNGDLSQKLGIDRVPSVVEREGKKIKITEVVL